MDIIKFARSPMPYNYWISDLSAGLSAAASDYALASSDKLAKEEALA